MICPVTKRIEINNKFVLDRVYPGKARPTVKPGQKVDDAEIIAHCEISAGQRLIRVGHILGVSGKETSKYLTRKIGDRIYEGEILAKKKGFFGVGKKEIRSPVDGVLSEIDSRGDLILKFLPRPIRLLAGATGTVKEVTESKITVESTGTKVHGFVSLGKQREGILSIIGGPKEFILPSKITSDVKGKVLVGGALIEKSALEKAVTLGAEGIVTGGINFRDFDSLGGGEDIGITIMVTEGFGSAPMGEDLWKYLEQKQGHLGFILGNDNFLILPEELNPNVKPVETSTSWRKLKVGDKVRYLRKESSNLLGEVKELLGEQIINSGILTEVARISFEGGKELLLPASNLEIVE